MGKWSFNFTIFFMLLGPVKLIPSFAGLTRGADARFKRDVAIRGVAVASALLVFLALAGGTLLSKYQIFLEALRIAAGLVLLIAEPVRLLDEELGAKWPTPVLAVGQQEVAQTRTP
jgi:multiple antibiotic resistance protein